MASSSRFYYKSASTNFTDKFSSNSMFKWNSRSNSLKPSASFSTNVWKSTPSTSLNSFHRSASSNSLNSFRETGGISIRGNDSGKKTGYLKIIDEKRIRRLQIPNAPPKKTVNNSFIRYDPNLQTLVKTIDLRPVSAPSISPIAFKPKPPLPVAKFRGQNPKGVVSRYKVVRNSTSAVQSSQRIKSSQSTTVDRKKTLPSGDSRITKIISKYKVRRRTTSFSSPANKRFGTFSAEPGRFRRSAFHSGDLVKRYKVVRKAATTVGSKNLYKVDRRRDKLR